MNRRGKRELKTMTTEETMIATESSLSPLARRPIVLAGLAAAACLALALAMAGQAKAAFGDDYGLMPINGGPGSGTLDVPALPDADHYFWAGACERSAVPAAGSDLAPLGGIGTMPSTATAPNNPGAEIVEVPLLGSVRHCIDWRLGNTGTGQVGRAADNIWTPPPSWRLPDATRAGAHPDGTAAFAFLDDGDTDNIYVDLPPGFVGNPEAVTKCTADQFAVKPQQCPPSSQVGILTLSHTAAPLGGENFGGGQGVNTVPVFNLEPRRGNVAELGLVALTRDGRVTARLVAKARTNSDFGVTTFIGQLPGSALPLSQQAITIWGVPWAADNDVWRAPIGLQGGTTGCNAQEGTSVPEVIPPGGFTAECRESYEPSWGPIKPFITNITGPCDGSSPVTRLATDAYQNPGTFIPDGRPNDGPVVGPRNGDPDPSDPNWRIHDAEAAPVTSCEDLDFEPEITLQPTSSKADSPTGLDVELTLPQNDDPPPSVSHDPGDPDDPDAGAPGHWRSDQGLATAHLKDTVVTLPEGMAVSPSAAWGLEACTTDQVGLKTTSGAMPNPIRFNNAPVKCPNGSTIGTLSIDSPLLEDPLPGRVYLAAQDDNPFDSLLAIYLVAEDDDLGLRVKLAGHVEPDESTGQLKTTFLNNPQLPFETFRLRFKGGDRATLVNPPACGVHVSESRFTPWSAPNDPVTTNDAFTITQSANGGPCPASAAARAFNPGFNAGLINPTAATSSPFVLRFTREDGDQELLGIDTVLPEGVAAKLAGVAQCSEPQANAGTCGPASKVGEVRAGAGPGPTPFFVPTGEAHLTGPYKGAPLGLSIKVPAQAGPFDLGDVVVRAALHVNPITAQVTALSDDMPLILEGIPVRTRDVRVNMNRSDFMVAPTSCEPDAVRATIFGTHNSSAEVSERFQVAGCEGLDFGPRFRFQARGKRATRPNGHPRLTATVLAGDGEANIARARVTLPRGTFLDQDNLETICTRPQFAAGECPQNTRVGHAVAHSPLLDDPLQGPVYLIASDNPLPDIVADLGGIVDITLFGRVSSNRRTNRITNTFDVVPDAAVERFRLVMRGGPQGLLVNSRDTCRKAVFRRANVRVFGHNGKAAHQARMVQSRRCARQRANQLTRRAKKLRQRAKRAARNGNKARAKKLRQRSRRLQRRATNIRQGLNQRRTP